MTRIRFNAPPHYNLVVDDKTTIAGGKEADVSEKVAAMLVACGYADVEIVDGSSTEPVWPGTHAELDTIAARVAVIWPVPPEGKTRLSVADKVAALEEAGHTPESVLEAEATPEEESEVS